MLVLFGVIKLPDAISNTIVLTLLAVGGFLDGYTKHSYRTALIPFYINLVFGIINIFSIVVLDKEFSLFGGGNNFFENIQFLQVLANISFPVLHFMENLGKPYPYIYMTVLTLIIPFLGYILGTKSHKKTPN